MQCHSPWPILAGTITVSPYHVVVVISWRNNVITLNSIISPRLNKLHSSLAGRQTGPFRSTSSILHLVSANASKCSPAAPRVQTQRAACTSRRPRVREGLPVPSRSPGATVYLSRSKSESDLCPRRARSNTTGLISASFILAGRHNATNVGKYWSVGYLRSGPGRLSTSALRD